MAVVPDLVPWLWDVIVKSRVLELVIYMLGCLVVVFLLLFFELFFASLCDKDE